MRNTHDKVVEVSGFSFGGLRSKIHAKVDIKHRSKHRNNKSSKANFNSVKKRKLQILAPPMGHWLEAKLKQAQNK
ncbi:hypothetical protein Lsai_1765 [Legionella sainthelensi]|uniref:Uncharacterized protein n=1 Tax=Legionella sainthelensi TaxID=28087 RepID=A0A0W0YJS9_9GAMM|nr:hypothetical protein [Legionella sainthelensi]KTD57161.1 hypothetical protein Lsai_1765 [Legionella sainthelensi]VEH37559.1 Uncharacterised protein [Legionella sainthelensi]